MARGCGAKHICKSKCRKHHNLGPILEVLMFKNGTRLWREAHLQVKMQKTPQSRTYFRSSDVQKWHAAVARSTFASQNAENTTISDLFWKFWCSKMARGCGAKHICKSKCRKHHNLGPILEVLMFKNGTRLWREAHLQVKMQKTPQSRTYFGSSDVQKWHAAVARSTFASQNAENTTISDLFWKSWCSKMARGCGAKHICKSKCVKHRILGPLFEVPMSTNGTPLWREAHL